MTTIRRAVLLLSLLLATVASAATFTVTNPADAGPDTFRQAILDANATPGYDQIRFTVSPVIIDPATPAITDPVDIDGTLPGGGRVEIRASGLADATAIKFHNGSDGSRLTHVAISNYTIAVFTDVGADGVVIVDNTLRGNLLITGSAASITGNVFPQPAVWQIAIYGNDTHVRRNTIAGVLTINDAAAATVVDDNTLSGTILQTGIRVFNQPITVNGTIISYNTISGYGTGVGVASTTFDVAIFGNRIFDTGIPIDLNLNGPTPNDPAPDADTGGNRLQNYPVLTSATLAGGSLAVQGTLTSAPFRTYFIELFADNAADPEARTPLALFSVTTDPAGNATFTRTIATPLPVADQVVTATAMGESGNTSEVSPAVAIHEPGTLGFAAAAFNVNETAGTATIVVTRTGGSEGTVTVQYATQPGTATAPADFTSTSGTLTFGPGVTSQSFAVPIVFDGVPEPEEFFTIALTTPTGGATLGTATTTVTIAAHLPGAPIPTASTWGLIALAIGLAAVTLTRIGR